MLARPDARGVGRAYALAPNRAHAPGLIASAASEVVALGDVGMHLRREELRREGADDAGLSVDGPPSGLVASSSREGLLTRDALLGGAVPDDAEAAISYMDPDRTRSFLPRSRV